MASYDKFESDSIKIVEYGSRSKLSKVSCTKCLYHWKLMAKKIRTSICPKCDKIETLKKVSEDEFITFSDRDEDMNYIKGIFTYKCKFCPKIFSKTLEQISLESPCTEQCVGNCERMKVLCKKANLIYDGPCRKTQTMYYFESDMEQDKDKCKMYTPDEMIVILRREQLRRGDLVDDIKPSIIL